MTTRCRARIACAGAVLYALALSPPARADTAIDPATIEELTGIRADPGTVESCKPGFAQTRKILTADYADTSRFRRSRNLNLCVIRPNPCNPR